METSAKTAMHVNEIFLAIAEKLPKSDQSFGGGRQGGGGINVSSDPTSTSESSSKSCCGGSASR